MNSKRFYYVLVGALALLLILSAASVYYGHKSLVTRNNTLSQLKARAEVLEDQERSLVLAKKDIEEYQGLRDVAKSIVPQEKDQARTVRELVAIADSLAIDISNISFPSSNLGEDGKKPSKTGGVSQVEPVDGIPGLFELNVDITASSEVTFDNLVNFLERLENNRRTSTISSITISPSGNDSSLLSFGLTVKVFIKP